MPFSHAAFFFLVVICLWMSVLYWVSHLNGVFQGGILKFIRCLRLSAQADVLICNCGYNLEWVCSEAEIYLALGLWFFLESCTSKRHRYCMQQCCCIDSGLLQQVLKAAAYHKIAPKDSLCQYAIKLSCRRYLSVTCRKGEKSVWLLRNATLLIRISNTDLDVCWWHCSFHSCLTSWLSW